MQAPPGISQSLKKIQQLQKEKQQLLIQKRQLQHQLQSFEYESTGPTMFIDKTNKILYWNKAIEHPSGLKATLRVQYISL